MDRNDKERIIRYVRTSDEKERRELTEFLDREGFAAEEDKEKIIRSVFPIRVDINTLPMIFLFSSGSSTPAS